MNNSSLTVTLGGGASLRTSRLLQILAFFETLLDRF